MLSVWEGPIVVHHTLATQTPKHTLYSSFYVCQKQSIIDQSTTHTITHTLHHIFPEPDFMMPTHPSHSSHTFFSLLTCPLIKCPFYLYVHSLYHFILKACDYYTLAILLAFLYKRYTTASGLPDSAAKCSKLLLSSPEILSRRSIECEPIWTTEVPPMQLNNKGNILFTTVT